jgi:hypothetical protein
VKVLKGQTVNHVHLALEAMFCNKSYELRQCRSHSFTFVHIMHQKLHDLCHLYRRIAADDSYSGHACPFKILGDSLHLLN